MDTQSALSRFGILLANYKSTESDASAAFEEMMLNVKSCVDRIHMDLLFQRWLERAIGNDWCKLSEKILEGQLL